MTASARTSWSVSVSIRVCGSSGDHPDPVGHGSRVSGAGGQHRAVAVDDLAEAGHPVLHQLAAGREDDDSGLGVDPHPASADREEQRDLGRPDHAAGLQDDVALVHVAAGARGRAAAARPGP